MPFPGIPRHLTGKMDSCIASVRKKNPKLSKVQAIKICRRSVVGGKSLDDVLKEFLDVDVDVTGGRATAIQPAQSIPAPQPQKAVVGDRGGQEMTGKGKTKTKNKKRKEGRRRPRRYEREQQESNQEVLIRAIQKNDPDSNLIEVDVENEEPVEVSVEVKTPDSSLDAVLEDMRKIAAGEGEAESDVEAKEIGRDDSGPMVVWTPFGGAETWEELDTYLEAADFEQTVRQATWEFGEMVGTVLGNPEHDLAEKGRRVAALAKGLTERGEDLRDEKDTLVEEGYIDLDSLTVFEKIKHTLNRLQATDTQQKVATVSESDDVMGVTSFMIFKDKEGQDRWFGWVTNRWRDQDAAADPVHGGEILTDDSHKDFVAWVDKNPAKRMPQLWPWHTKELAHKHRADWIDYAYGFLLMSGPLDKDEAEAIGKVAEKWDLGMSHGFYAVERKKDGGLITKYRSFEVSYVPLDFAANQWTDFTTIMKEAIEMGMNEDKRAMLRTLAPEGFVDELEEGASKTEALIDGLDVDTKEGEGEVTPESETEVEVAVEVTEVEAGTDVDVDAGEEAEPDGEEEVEKDPVGALRAEVGEAIGVIGGEVKAVADLVKVLVEKVDTTEQEEADAAAKKEAEAKELTPAASLVAIAKSAIGQEKTKIEKDDELGKKGPEEAEPNTDLMMGVPLLDNIKRQNLAHQEQFGSAPGGKFSVSSG